MNDCAELNIEQERAAFEAVFAELYDIRTRAAGHFYRDRFGNYENDRVGTSWRMWKARALLAERDDFAAECAEQARLVGMGAEREARLLAERDALRQALEAIVSHHDDYFKDSATESNMPWIGQARAALAQEQGDKE